MNKCPEGTVWSSNSKVMSEAGYSVETQQYPPNVCLPMPCKWFFEENGISFFNNNNIFTSNGCACDVKSGWIPTMTNNACVPLFENSKSLKHSAATLKFVHQPQTLHQYVYTQDVTPLAKHITNILVNLNTKQASPKLLLNEEKIAEKSILIAGEFDSNSFNIASKNAKKIMKAISMHGFLSKEYYDLGKVKECSHDKKSLLCAENKYLLLNESVAFAEAIGGVYWELDGKNLNIFLLKQNDSLSDIELKYGNF